MPQLLLFGNPISKLKQYQRFSFLTYLLFNEGILREIKIRVDLLKIGTLLLEPPKFPIILIF